jgi:PAS domain S-box-containing protein
MPKIPEEINLLYIEDDETISDIMVQYLHTFRNIDFNIIVKNTLKDGLEYLNDRCMELDAVLLDLVLPNSKGVDTFKSVNKKCGYILPIVIISGFEDMACKCVKLGAQDYLLKPDITPGLLVRSIKYAIERKKIKEKLKIERDKSIQSEKKFRELVEVTKAGIYEIDFINNKFVYVNDVICKNIGYTKKEFMKLSPQSILTKEGINKWNKRMTLLIKGEHIPSSTDYEVIRKDGSIGWILITAKYIEDKNNNIIGANVVAIDITDRKLAKKALKKKEEDVYKTLENKIRNWREEIVARNVERDTHLDLIDGEIQSMTDYNDALEMF